MSIIRYRTLHFLVSSFFLLATHAVYAQFSEDPVLTLETRKGIRVQIYSEIDPLDINRIHSWMLHLSQADGTPLSGATIEVIGGMPEHDHGLPTQPQITAETAEGEYLLEGVRFHMPGKWQLSIQIDYLTTTETATIDFEL